MKLKTAHFLLASLLLALPTRADFITGRVVDQFGVGVPGVDIDVKNLGSGGTPDIFNDGTDAFGNFTTTLPAGFYRVTFTPPVPPTSTHLITEVDDVIVVGTKSMGTIELPPGVAITGVVRNAASLPVAGVNLDVIDLATGDNLLLAGDTTDAFGGFAIAAPATSIELRFKTAGVLGPTLAPRSMNLQLTGGVALGVVELEPGFRVSGTVVGPGFQPIEDADFDFTRARSGTAVFTPDDNTNAAGAFSIVVPAGRFRAELCPVNGELLVARAIDDLLVTQNTSLGLLQLEAGVRLTGTVRAFDGSIVPGADVDVDRLDGSPVLLCADNANAAGVYSVVVPSDVVDLEFDPPGFGLPLGSQDIKGVNIVGNTVVDASLPSCPFGVTVGAGTPGTGGLIPTLAPVGGAPRAGNTAYGLELTGGLGGSQGFLGIALSPTFSSRLPNPAGQLFPVWTSPAALSSKSTPLGGSPGLAGAGTVVFAMPVDSSMIGTSIVVRGYVLDTQAPGSVASTNALSVNFCE